MSGCQFSDFLFNSPCLLNNFFFELVGMQATQYISGSVLRGRSGAEGTVYPINSNFRVWGAVKIPVKDGGNL